MTWIYVKRKIQHEWANFVYHWWIFDCQWLYLNLSTKIAQLSWDIIRKPFKSNVEISFSFHFFFSFFLSLLVVLMVSILSTLNIIFIMYYTCKRKEKWKYNCIVYLHQRWNQQIEILCSLAIHWANSDRIHDFHDKI